VQLNSHCFCVRFENLEHRMVNRTIQSYKNAQEVTKKYDY
jgi:hypothetical protein